MFTCFEYDWAFIVDDLCQFKITNPSLTHPLTHLFDIFIDFHCFLSGQEVDVPDCNGQTPLMLAAQKIIG